MISQDRAKTVTWLCLLLALLLWLPVTAQAQEDEAEDEEITGMGDVFLELGSWISQPSGLEYYPATITRPTDPFATELLGVRHGTSAKLRYRVGYVLSGGRGAFIGTWYAHGDEAGTKRRDPGRFVYGELLAHPSYAGFANDGLADSFTATTATVLRDLRLDYYRSAFETKRTRGRWFVGYRRLNHKRSMEVSYFPVDPDTPPFFPPAGSPELNPRADLASVTSSYVGRGLEAGLEVDIPLWKDKIWLETGLTLAILRGKVDAQYISVNRVYLGPEGELLDPADYGDAIDQVNRINGLVVERLDRTSLAQELHLAVRWKAWRTLEAFFGFRDQRFEDVGLDLLVRPSPSASGDNLTGASQTDRSVVYEGFFGGVSYRF